eukprot:SAG11_NODE_25830_length_353_cov_1.003937_1_plen_47_part_10
MIPTFEKLYPDKKMALVMDNAPYHHCRGIGSLSGMSKRALLLEIQKA